MDDPQAPLRGGPLQVVGFFIGAEDAPSVGEEFARLRKRRKYDAAQERKAAPDWRRERFGAFGNWVGPEVYVCAQLAAGAYRCDFAYVDGCSGDLLCVVEIDEDAHRNSWPLDLQRDRFFTLQRIPVLRFTEHEIRESAPRCAFIATWFALWLSREAREIEHQQMDLWLLENPMPRSVVPCEALQ